MGTTIIILSIAVCLLLITVMYLGYHQLRLMDKINRLDTIVMQHMERTDAYIEREKAKNRARQKDTQYRKNIQ